MITYSPTFFLYDGGIEDGNESNDAPRKRI